MSGLNRVKEQGQFVMSADDAVSVSDDLHVRLMQRCLALAGKARGRTAPNPMVGALVVSDDGEVISEGFHSQAGSPHAEVEALNAAGEAARGKTLVVNLEPCCHHGRTPPCIDRVIASGIKRVVVGMSDPNPKVSGGGISALREAGVEVVEGICESDCRYVNRAFVKRMTRGLPWVHLKLASTLDGKVADRNGGSRWITGDEARLYVHRLRNECDAAIVGAATVVADDPQLNVRGIEHAVNPLRVVIAGRSPLPPSSCRVFQAQEGDRRSPPAVLFAVHCALLGAEGGETSGKPASCSARDTRDGPSVFPETCQVVEVTPEAQDGVALSAVLRWLSVNAEVNEALVEGGGRLAAAFLDLGLVDEVHWFVAPKVLVDREARQSLSGRNFRPIAEAIELSQVRISTFGSDVLFHGFAPPGAAQIQEI